MAHRIINITEDVLLEEINQLKLNNVSLKEALENKKKDLS